MRFLLDMGLALSTAEFLRRRGHDAVHLRDETLQRSSDASIVDKALSEHRIILTHDLDFSRIVAISREQAPSVITFRLANMTPARVNSYLGEILDRFAFQLEVGALISVSEPGIRVRLLPIPK